MSSIWPDPLWPEEVELQSDLTSSEWIFPRLLPSILSGGRGTPVAAVVPSGYPAYVRVLHPLGDESHRPSVSWREIARETGRTYHPLMQFDRIKAFAGGRSVTSPGNEPWPGHLSTELCRTLYETLAPWTKTPDVCWLGIWEGYGQLSAPGPRLSVSFFSAGSRDQREEHAIAEQRMLNQWSDLAGRVRQLPTFDHPGRSYFLAKAPASSIWKLGRFPLGLTPNLVWPEDRSWCVGTEIDFDSTLVACSEECAAAVVANEALEALPINAQDRLDIGGDVLND